MSTIAWSRFGNPTNAAEAAAVGRVVSIAGADRFAANVLPLIETIRAASETSVRGSQQH